jgi:RNA polymerase sigma-70 factor (ECF subfamily)
MMHSSAAAAMPEKTAQENLRPPGESMDHQLLAGIRAGDVSSFERLVAEQSPRLVNLAYRLTDRREDAEEIVQEAFFRLHRSLDDFRGESSLGTWLYRTVSRLAIDHLRRERLKRRIFFFRKDESEPDPIEIAVDPAGRGPDRHLQDQQLRQQLRHVLSKLPPRQKSVFVLRHYEELSIKEIAAVLNLEDGTVKTHLHRAVQLLRRELDEPAKG